MPIFYSVIFILSLPLGRTPQLYFFIEVINMGNLRKKLGKAGKNMYRTSDTKNLAGGKAWKKLNEEYFRQLMFTGGFHNTYYMDERKVIEESIDAIERFIKNHPEEAAKIAIEGRNKGFMRVMPIIVVAKLTKGYAYKEAFNKIIRTPRDLIDFIDIVRNERGLGRSIKKVIGEYINKNEI